MNDREWEDYVMRNPASPYPCVQDIIHLEKNSTPSTGGVARRTTPGESEEGLVASFLRLLGEKSEAISEKWFPFKQLVHLADRIVAFNKITRVPIAVFGVVSGLAFVSGPHGLAALSPPVGSWLAENLDWHRFWIAAALGALAGWNLIAVLGGALNATVRLIAFMVVLAATLGVLFAAYALAAAFLDWPIPWPW